jgi:hypothetical protein
MRCGDRLRSPQIAAHQRRIKEISQPDREGNNAKGGRNPGIRLDASDQPEGDAVAERACHQQDAQASGTGRLRELRLHGNTDAAGDGRQALFAAQLAHPVIGVQGGHGNAEYHDDRYDWNHVVAHNLLLLSRLGAHRLAVNLCHWQVRECRPQSSVRVSIPAVTALCFTLGIALQPRRIYITS